MDVSILREPRSLAPLLLGSSIANDIAHDTTKGSITRAHEGINSMGNIVDTYYPIECTLVDNKKQRKIDLHDRKNI